MYKWWSNLSSEATGPAPNNIGGDLAPPVGPFVGLAHDEIRRERDRQRSVDLLRGRAFAVRETTAEEQVRTLQGELAQVRSTLNDERQELQGRIDELRKEIGQANALLAAERHEAAEATARERDEAQARLEAAVSKAISDGEQFFEQREREMGEKAQRQAADAQQQRQVRAHCARQRCATPVHQRCTPRCAACCKAAADLVAPALY